jgi:N-acetylmuramoyl-L-alanine amidase
MPRLSTRSQAGLKPRSYEVAGAIAALLLAGLALLACTEGGASTPEGDTVAGKLEAPVEATASPTPGPPTVVIDAGHGGREVGAAANGVVEKESNLDIAFRVQRLLEEHGVRVVLTRTEDARLVPDALGAGFGVTRADLQARIDLANREGAEVLVSLHSNGSSDAGQSGVEVWYDPNRPFAADNERLARLLLERALASLDAYGYAATDRGLKDDTCFRFRFNRCFPLFLLGPARGATATRPASRASEMPGALIESLFVTNAGDAAVLRDDAGRDAIARGIADSILAFLEV